MNVMWFRRDLRLLDNPGFYHCVKQGPCVAVYCLSDEQWDRHHVSQGQRQLILSQLKQLAVELSELNIPFVVLHTNTFERTPNILFEYMTSISARALYFNEEYEINEAGLTKQIHAKASQHANSNVRIHSFHDQCLIEPGEIINKQAQPYKVFTAFKKSYMAQLSLKMRFLYGKPEIHNHQKTVNVKSDLTALRIVWDGSMDPYAGEHQSHKMLAEFTEDKLNDYKKHRDLPSVKGTSELSAYMAIGMLSVRQCWQAVHVALNSKSNSSFNDEGVQTWISELIWRDFYRHLIFFYPKLCKGHAFKGDTDRLPWKQDQKLLLAWQQGQTGYPIVDAAMRQLNETGWMHNRLRMVTAMFFTKHLFLDWRLGERYFMEKLIDGDFASNNGGWQWSASTGVDAAPYFRIFNPVRQSERFDANGDFLRQYLPELRSLDNRSIHMPSTLQAQSLGYPLPIVQHKEAVAQTKQWFKALNDPESIKINPNAPSMRMTNNKIGKHDLFGDSL